MVSLSLISFLCTGGHVGNLCRPRGLEINCFRRFEKETRQITFLEKGRDSGKVMCHVEDNRTPLGYIKS